MKEEVTEDRCSGQNMLNSEELTRPERGGKDVPCLRSLSRLTYLNNSTIIIGRCLCQISTFDVENFDY